MTEIACAECGEKAKVPPDDWCTKCTNPSCNVYILAPIKSGKKYTGCEDCGEIGPVNEDEVIDKCSCGDGVITSNILEVRNEQTVYETAVVTSPYKQLYNQYKATRDRLKIVQNRNLVLEADRILREKHISVLKNEKLHQDTLYCDLTLNFVQMRNSKRQEKEKNKQLREELEREMRGDSEAEIQELRERLEAKEDELKSQVEEEKKAKERRLKLFEDERQEMKKEMGDALNVRYSLEVKNKELEDEKEALQKRLEMKEKEVRALSASLILASRNQRTHDKSAISARVKEEPLSPLSDAVRKRHLNTPENEKVIKTELLSSHSESGASRKRSADETDASEDGQSARKRRDSELFETRAPPPSRATSTTSSAAFSPDEDIVKNGNGQIDISRNTTNVGPSVTPSVSN